MCQCNKSAKITIKWQIKIKTQNKEVKQKTWLRGWEQYYLELQKGLIKYTFLGGNVICLYIYVNAFNIVNSDKKNKRNY